MLNQSYLKSTTLITLLYASIAFSSAWQLPANTLKIWMMDRISAIDNEFDGQGQPVIPAKNPFVQQTYLNMVWSPTQSQEISIFIPILYNLGLYNIQKPSSIETIFSDPQIASLILQYQIGLTDKDFTSTLQTSYEYHRLNDLHTLSLGYSYALDPFNWQVSASLNVYGVLKPKGEYDIYAAPLIETYKPITDSFKFYLSTNGAYSTNWFFWKTTTGFEYLVQDNFKVGSNISRNWIGKWVYKDIALELFMEVQFEY